MSFFGSLVDLGIEKRLKRETFLAMRGRFPAALTELYSEWDGYNLLRKYSNSDHPFEAHDLGDRERASYIFGDRPLGNVLPFMNENQGVCIWALLLDGSDDPPVLVAVNKPEWQPCADHFSTFVFCQIWDYKRVVGFPDLNHLYIYGQGPGPNNPAALGSQFRRLPDTRGWPGDRQYRFENGEARLLLWEKEGEFDWNLAADSDAAMRGLFETIPELTDLVLTGFDERAVRFIASLSHA